MPEPDGIKAKKLIELVKKLSKKSIGISISEYNPLNDKEDKTKKVALEIVEAFVENNS